MDIGAELTLQIAHRVQSRAFPADALAPVREDWLLWPGGDRLPWNAAREALAQAPKPLLLAPLLEPMMIGVWTVDALDEARRQVITSELDNARRYFTRKLEATTGDRGVIRFESRGTSYELDFAAFLDWTQAYALNVGVSLVASREDGVTRVLVRPPGGGEPLTL